MTRIAPAHMVDDGKSRAALAGDGLRMPGVLLARDGSVEAA